MAVEVICVLRWAALLCILDSAQGFTPLARLTSPPLASTVAASHLPSIKSRTLLGQTPTIMAEQPRARPLGEWLNVLPNQTLAQAVGAVFDAALEVSDKIRTASCDSRCCFNNLGVDEQLAIDVLAETVMFERLSACGAIATASTAQEPYEMPLGGQGFSAALDPLDSSSSVDVNFAVGASWTIFPGERLTGISGRDAAAAGLVTYGPRTTMLVAIRGEMGVTEFVLARRQGGNPGWEWLEANIFSSMAEDAPHKRAIFAPGNLRATVDNPGYHSLIDYYLSQRYQLRYSGGLVPDIAQLIIRGCGILTNPHGGNQAPARLKLLYEAIPAAFVMEATGGASSNGETSILDIVVTDTDNRVQVAIGSPGEVERFEALVGSAVVQPVHRREQG